MWCVFTRVLHTVEITAVQKKMIFIYEIVFLPCDSCVLFFIGIYFFICVFVYTKNVSYSTFLTFYM